MISGLGGSGDKDISQNNANLGQTVIYAMIPTKAITIITPIERALILNFTLPSLVPS